MAETLDLPAVRSDSLLGYLKGLGLLTVVARQADPAAAISWRGGTLSLHSQFDESGLEQFLLDAWKPAPIVSPWNGGSGFHPGDNTKAIEAIEASDDPRLIPLQTAVGAARRALQQLGLQAKPDPKHEKPALLRALRATLPDDALAWLDAAVVLQDDRISYPPALGSGGNDGRYDFANNYAQSVWAALAASHRRAALRGALLGESVALTRKLSLAHLTRDASPVNSPAGESDALGNPWDLVLALHGALLWAAGATRRLSAVHAGHAAPFTLRPTAAGYGSAVSGEAGRAELWMPTWDRPSRFAEIEALFREGRAQVGRRQATTGLDAARAAGELGVARGITGFERVVVLERAGLSNLAVHAGRIDVRANPATTALSTLDPWLPRVLQYGTGDIPQALRPAIRALEQAAFALAESATPARAAAVLGAVGAVEAALARTDDASTRGLRALRAPAAPWVRLLDAASVEHRLAVGFAALRDHERQPGSVPIRDALTGFGREYADRAAWVAPVSATLPVRLAAIAERRWLSMEHDGNSELAPGGFPYGPRTRVADLERFAAGAVDDELIARLLCGLTRLQWRADTPRLSAPRAPAWPPDPLLRLLLLAVHTDAAPEAARPLERDWPTLVRAGGAHLLRARDAAHRHLTLIGRPPLVPAKDVQPRRAASGARLAAALLARPSRQDLAALADQLITPPDKDDTKVESPA